MSAILALTPASTNAAGIAPPDDIRQALAAYIDGHSHAAIALGVVDGSNTATYIQAGADVHSPVTERSTFQIGSITKTFTATLLAQMTQSGEVALSDPIAKYLPSGVKAPDFNGQQITLLNLAEQNSGLPRLPTNLDVASSNPFASYTDAQLWSFLSGYALTRAPGAQYEYSNLGVGLLGQLLGLRTHKSYAELIKARILEPLGMKQTTVRASGGSRERLVPGFTAEGRPRAPWDFDALSGAGSIESDLSDMLRFLRANMRPPGDALGKAMAFAQEPRFPMEDTGTVKLGLVWITNTRTQITFHNGETGGYYAFLGFDRADHGVVLLANVADNDIERIAFHVLIPSVAAAVPLEPSPFSGVYPLSSDFAITIFQSNGHLFERATGQQSLPLRLISGSTYGVEGVDAQITFDLDAKGNATGLTLHQGGADRHASKSATP